MEINVDVMTGRQLEASLVVVRARRRTVEPMSATHHVRSPVQRFFHEFRSRWIADQTLLGEHHDLKPQQWGQFLAQGERRIEVRQAYDRVDVDLCPERAGAVQDDVVSGSPHSVHDGGRPTFGPGRCLELRKLIEELGSYLSCETGQFGEVALVQVDVAIDECRSAQTTLGIDLVGRVRIQ